MAEQEQQFDYHPDNSSKPARGSSGTVSWIASEYIEHQRGAGWYLGLMVGSFGIAAVIYIWQKDVIATGIILILGVIVGVSAGRKPSQVGYQIDAQGLSVGSKLYPYSQFRSFSIIREGHLNSLVLTPLKRLMPPITAYFDQADESKITSVIGERLPLEQRQPDRIDNLTRRLRF